MAKLNKKAPKEAKETVESEVQPETVEKSKKKQKKPKSGNLEKNVKKVVKNGGSNKETDIAQALEVKDQIQKKKMEKSAKKKAKKAEKLNDPIPAHEEGNSEVPEELVNDSVLEKAVSVAKEGVEKERSTKESKDLFDEDLRYGLEVIFMKVPEMPNHARRVTLKHSIHPDNVDICLIVRDDENDKAKDKDRDHDAVIHKYEQILKEQKVTSVKAIIPLSKLKQDYGPHSMKIKLLNTYDLFLVEPQIADHTYSILGKHFILKRKRPIQIDFGKKEILKEIIDKAKYKATFKIGPKSNMTSIEVGTHKMDNEKIVENIETTLEQLKEKFPRGWLNIKRIYYHPLKPSKVHLPLYYSKVDPNCVEVPKDKGWKQSRLDKITEEMSKKTKKVKIDKDKKKVVKTGAKNQNANKNKQKNQNNKNKRTSESEGGDSPAKKNKVEAKEENGVEGEVAPKTENKNKKKKNKNKNKNQSSEGPKSVPTQVPTPKTPEEKKAAKKEKLLKKKQKKLENKENATKTETTETVAPATNGSPSKAAKKKEKFNQKKEKKLENALNEENVKTSVDKKKKKKQKGKAGIASAAE